jgi:hypothetical protein
MIGMSLARIPSVVELPENLVDLGFETGQLCVRRQTLAAREASLTGE